MNSKEGNNNTAKKGRKTKYTPKIVERICELVAKDTYSVPELCRAVGIDEATFYRWKNDKSEFCEALEKAEDKRLAFFATEAKRSLLKKIQGYTVQEKHIVTVGSGKFDVNGKEIPRIKEQKTVDKHIHAYQRRTGTLAQPTKRGSYREGRQRPYTARPYIDERRS